ncbi:MAG: hypothetical protein CMN21_07600 [Rubinisphaera sp.]|nr:hypothetical protein [Rubinisphaera sp.]
MISPQTSRLPWGLGIAVLLLSLCIGCCIGWFSLDNRLDDVLKSVSLVVFVLLTTVASWQLRRYSPIIGPAMLGGICAAGILVGWGWGECAATYAATGRLVPVSLIGIGTFMYSLIGLFFGAIGGMIIGGMLSLLIRLHLFDARSEPTAPGKATQIEALEFDGPASRSSSPPTISPTVEDKFVR